MDIQNILDFLLDLELHNDRDWFHANRPRYLQAKQNFEELIQALIVEIGRTDSSVLHLQAKDLMFKLMRDTRFSKDKSPYNPAFRAHIGCEGKPPIPVGYFVVIKPGDRSFLGGGLFADMFKNATAMVRDAIAAHGEAWERVITAPGFAKHFSVKGTALKNVPRGYDLSHPQAAFFKNKSWYLEFPVSDKQLLQVDFVSFAADVFAAMQPFNAFLNEALEGFKMPPR